MRQKFVPEKEPAAQVVKDIRRATRRHFSAEDKIRIVLEGPARRGQDRGALPPRGHRPEPVLRLVERLSRGGEEVTNWRYSPGPRLRTRLNLRREASARKLLQVEGHRYRESPACHLAQRRP
jgi:hypothetical protein